MGARVEFRGYHLHRNHQCLKGIGSRTTEASKSFWPIYFLVAGPASLSGFLRSKESDFDQAAPCAFAQVQVARDNDHDRSVPKFEFVECDRVPSMRAQRQPSSVMGYSAAIWAWKFGPGSKAAASLASASLAGRW